MTRKRTSVLLFRIYIWFFDCLATILLSSVNMANIHTNPIKIFNEMFLTWNAPPTVLQKWLRNAKDMTLTLNVVL